MVDRELVFPKHLDSIIPPWLNHVMVSGVISPTLYCRIVDTGGSIQLMTV